MTARHCLVPIKVFGNTSDIPAYALCDLRHAKGDMEANKRLSACVAFRSDRGDATWPRRLSGWRLKVPQSSHVISAEIIAVAPF